MKIHDQEPKLSSSLRPVLRATAPGRINLIGEHTDYNGGKVLPFAMDRSIEFTLSQTTARIPRSQAVYTVTTSSHPGCLEITGSELATWSRQLQARDPYSDLRSELPDAIASSWTRYAVGSLVNFWRLAQTCQDSLAATHTHIHIQSKLPYGAGISSSAALTSGMIASLLEADGQSLDRPQIARAAMRVEHQFAGIRCGLMDQLAILLCEADALLLIDFLHLSTRDEITTEAIRLHRNFAPYRAVLINTMVKHELGSSPYNERRLACERGVGVLSARLGKDYPTPGHLATDAAFMQRFVADQKQATLIKNLTEFAFAKDPLTPKRLAHAILEVTRVDAAVAAIKSGDLVGLTQAINSSHDSLAHDYEVSCPELDMLRQQTLATAAALAQTAGLKMPGILGARMTGGGFGGSTIQLVHEHIVPALQDAMCKPKGDYFNAFQLVPEIIVTGLCNGLRLHRPDPSP